MEEIWGGWGGVVLVTATTIVGALIVFVLIWQIFRTLQTWLASRADVAHIEEYRHLTERAVTAQEKFAEEQQRVASELAETRRTVANMERLLREVE